LEGYPFLTEQTETICVAVTHLEKPGREAVALEKATGRVEANAKKVADSLGLRLLELLSIEKNISQRESVVEARVEASYRVSAFSQVRFDLRLLSRSRLFEFLRKELFMRLFQFRYRQLLSAPVSLPDRRPGRALVTGHFSVPGGGGTFGDIEAQEMACEWLAEAGIPFDVATNLEDGVEGVRLEDASPADYGIFIFVCGPWYPEKAIPSMLLRRYAHCLKIGINLTTSHADQAGFDVLLARDNPNEIRADIAFGKAVETVPVVGVLLVERQTAYGSRQRHLYVRQVFEDYLKTAHVVPVWLDTVIKNNKAGLHTGAEFESLLRKVDVLITNRLHGLVLGLKNSVPVVAVDSIAGGGKVTAQAKALGWPVLVPVEELDVEKLAETVQMCFEQGMKAGLEKSHQQGDDSIARTRAEFLEILRDFNRPESP
jgi:hypothetical protein